MFKKILILTTALIGIQLLAEPVLKDCVIVSPDSPETYEAEAIAEAAEQLGKAAGKKLPVVKESLLTAKTGRIFIGNTKAAVKAGLKKEKLGKQDFRIVSSGNDVHILGGTSTGTLYGVYEFAQRCGVWQIAPGAESVEVNPNLKLPRLDLRMSPAIKQRELYHAGFFYNDRKGRINWYLFDKRNRINRSMGNFLMKNQPPGDLDQAYQVSKEGNGGHTSHTFYFYIPPKQYFKGHPEYFGMNQEGHRTYRPSGQLCFTNPDVRKLVLAKMLANIKQDRSRDPKNYPLVYDFSQEDNCNYLCCCPECKKIIAKYGNVDSGLLLWFINDIAREVAKKYPDVFIRTFAYVNTEKPPTGIRAEKNVIVELTDLYSKCNHLLPLTHPANRPRMELYKQWSKICSRLMMWDYLLDGGGYPFTPVDAIVPDTKLFRDLGIDWIFLETEMNQRQPASNYDLKNFIVAQIWFNPDQDLEKLIQVFFKGYYGPAAPKMLAYHEYIRKMQLEKPTADMIKWHQRDLAHINLPFLEKCRGMVLGALKDARTEQQKTRILRELNTIDSALMKVYKRIPAKKSERAALVKGFLANTTKVIDSLHLVPVRSKKMKKQLQDAIAAENLHFELPQELKSVDPNRLILLGHPHIGIGKNSRKEKDPDSVMPLAGVWRNVNAKRFHRRIGIGAYDWSWKKSRPLKLQVSSSDEKYHWYKVGVAEIGPNTKIWFLDWQIGFNLSDFYIISDGAEVNPNIYEIWISLKAEGPAYNPQSKKENAIWIDRAVLVRKQ